METVGAKSLDGDRVLSEPWELEQTQKKLVVVLGDSSCQKNHLCSEIEVEQCVLQRSSTYVKRGRRDERGKNDRD